MALTYLARNAGAPVGHEIVVKRILAELRDDPVLRALFGVEAGISQHLDHPNIVKSLPPVEIAGELVLPMEFVWGEDLRTLADRAVTTGQPLRLPEVVFIIAQAARGLHHFHTRRSSDGVPLGLVHRDVSPPNVMVSYTGQVKVLDFGVARAETTFMEVRPGQLPGKFGYMSPEQVDGLEVTAKSDQFALGVILFELSLIRRLFKADSDLATMRLVSRAQIPAPESIQADFPSSLASILLRALARAPEDRFESCAAFADALDAVDLGLPSSGEEHLGGLIRAMFADRIAETRLALSAGYDGPFPLDAPERRRRLTLSPPESGRNARDDGGEAVEAPANAGAPDATPRAAGGRTNAFLRVLGIGIATVVLISILLRLLKG